jgi:hypothetical protein
LLVVQRAVGLEPLLELSSFEPLGAREGDDSVDEVEQVGRGRGWFEGAGFVGLVELS